MVNVDHRAPGVLTPIRYAIPATILILASVLALFVLPRLTKEPDTFATALTIDLTLVVPLLVYLIFVRSGKWPLISLVPAFFFCLFAASLVLPANRQTALDLIKFLVAPIEVGVFVYLAYLARKTAALTKSGDGDFVMRLRSAADNVLKNRLVAGILTTEMAVIYYAFGSIKENPGGFTMHRKSGYSGVFFGLALIIAVETLALHFLISAWNPVVAWIFTGLSLYALIWLTGDYRALVNRTMYIKNGELVFTLGIRWEAVIPFSNIKEIRQPVKSSGARNELKAVLIGEPNLELLINSPVTIKGMYGFTRTIDRLQLRLDNPSLFVEQMRKSG